MKIFKKIGLIALAVLVGVASIFLPMTNRQPKTAHADTTTTSGTLFSSSDIFFTNIGNSFVQPTVTTQFTDLTASYNNANGIGMINDETSQYYSWRFKIGFNDYRPNNANTSWFNLYAMGSYGAYNGTIESYNNAVVQFQHVGMISTYSMQSNQVDGRVIDRKTIWVGSSTRYSYSIIGVMIDFPDEVFNESDYTQPSLDMVTIEVGNFYNFPNRDIFPSSFSNSNVICYTDSTGYSYYFFIPSLWDYTDVPETNTGFLNYRKYYTPKAFDFSNDDFYAQGFNDGRNEGLSAGEELGYKNGYDVGYQQGELEGFNQGAESANNYTFLSLIGAVVDAPVSVFKTMFNFDLLGVNLKDFFLAILTFCGITLLVKFALLKG